MYGRGVDDDKGHITARLSALRKYMQHHDDLPVNISFIMEGAEESASTDLDKYLEKHADKLRGADLLVWEQGTKNALEQLEISGGNKGIVTFDAKVKALMWISTRVMVVLWNQLLGISSKPYSLFVLRMAVSWLKACTKKYKSPMNEKWPC